VSNDSQQKESEAEAVAMSSIPYLQTQPQLPEETGHKDPFSPTSPTSPTLLVSPADADGKANGGSTAPISVEEAVQNVSLQ
jgi:hypothetical protein